jgi:hypothetical protein
MHFLGKNKKIISKTQSSLPLIMHPGDFSMIFGLIGYHRIGILFYCLTLCIFLIIFYITVTRNFFIFSLI